MTREEEIKKASDVFAHDVENAGDRLLLEVGFRHGVLWADEHQKNPWISVEDRMPDKAIGKSERSKYVLCRHKNGNYYVAYWHVGLEYWYSMPYMIDKSNITHWMPIPEPPTKEQNKAK